ncbi:hypothetical protein AVEN_62418-1 [Araneus ventricosus]|uniref:Uncharacterized protein n=1 Tax=Araneus ventricosus TaxID=182803 RepID=A0A4Y2IL66_ARAVE|nr:hypothetical protein AVEN_62418-1 [Araneus ventricosus]
MPVKREKWLVTVKITGSGPEITEIFESELSKLPTHLKVCTFDPIEVALELPTIRCAGIPLSKLPIHPKRLCDESGIIYKEDYNRLDPRLNKPRWPGGNVLASGAERSWFETRLHRVSGMYECLVHMKSDVKGQGSILVWELGWVLTLTTEPNPTGGTRIDPSNHFPLVQCGSDGVTARRLSPPFDHRLTRSLPK